MTSTMSSSLSTGGGAGLGLLSSTTIVSRRTSCLGGGGAGLRCRLTSMTSLLSKEDLREGARRVEGPRRGERDRRRVMTSSTTSVLPLFPKVMHV